MFEFTQKAEWLIPTMEVATLPWASRNCAQHSAVMDIVLWLRWCAVLLFAVWCYVHGAWERAHTNRDEHVMWQCLFVWSVFNTLECHLSDTHETAV